MISAIFGFLSMALGWLVTHLPQSPFANLTFSDLEGFGTYTIQELLAWVNWLIPFQGMVGLFSLWIAAIVTASAVLFVLRKGLKIGTSGVLGGEN